MSTHGKSYRLIGEGGQKFWDEMRKESQAIVYVLTDDVEIPIAHYLGVSHGGYHKVVYCAGQKRGKGRNRGMVYEAVTIDPARIVEWRTIG